MATMRVHKTGDYTVMSNRHFREKEMTLKAKGLLSLMLSLPDDWDYSVAGLATLSKDGKDGVNAALRELEKFGYLVRTRTTDAGGKFTGYDYDIYEEPIRRPDGEKPTTGKPYPEKPYTANPQQLSTNQQMPNQPSTNERIDKQDRKDRKDETGEAGLPPSSDHSLGITEREYRLFDEMKNREAIEREVYLKPTALTKMIVKAGYISRDDPYMNDYNLFLNGLKDDYGFDTVRDCISYFLDRIKGNRDSIGDRRSYFKASMESGIANYTRDWNRVYELAGGK